MIDKENGQPHSAKRMEQTHRRIIPERFGGGLLTRKELNEDLRVFAATSQAVRAYLDERALPERLASAGQPLLVIFGQQDRRWRPSSAAEYRAVPGATVELLPGLGYSPNLEDPARTAAALLAFTARRSA